MVNDKINALTRIQNIVKKVNDKINALARILNCIPKKKLRITMKTFVNTQFSYCQVIWIFHSGRINHKVKKLRQRALRIVYEDHFSSFEELLSKGKPVTAHERNLIMFSTEMHKTLNRLFQTIMQNIFKTKVS